MKTWFWERSLHATRAPCQRLKSLDVLKSTTVDLQTVFLCGTHLREKKKKRNLHYKAAFPHRAALYNLKIA